MQKLPQKEHWSFRGMFSIMENIVKKLTTQIYEYRQHTLNSLALVSALIETCNDDYAVTTLRSIRENITETLEIK